MGDSFCVNDYRKALGKPPVDVGKSVLPAAGSTTADKAALPPRSKSGHAQKTAVTRQRGKRGTYKKTLPDAPMQSHRAGHWWPSYDADMDRIAQSQTPKMLPMCWAAWSILQREASYRRSFTFDLSDELLAKRLGCSRNTARSATAVLHSLGMLKSETAVIPGTKALAPLTRTISAAKGLLKDSPEPDFS